MRGIARNRRPPGLVAALLLICALASCERSNGEAAAGEPARQPVEVFVVSSLEPLVQSALDVYAPARAEFDFFIRPGSSQSLARQVAAGVRADLVVSANPESLAGVEPPALAVTPWVINRLVVATAPSSTGLMRDFDFGSARIAVANDSTELGLHTRLAMRQRETWSESQARIDWASDAADVIDRVGRGASEFGVVHATDARRAGLRVVDELDLPDSVELDYFLAPFSAEGARLAAWLASPEGQTFAERLGYEAASPQ